MKGFFPLLGQLPLQQSLSTVQKDPIGEQLLGVGAGGVGAGPSPVGQASCHQHTLPPFPQLSGLFSVEQLPPAGKPSAHIVVGIGSFFAHTYLAREDAAVGLGVG
jgi:hypothetical protein